MIFGGTEEQKRGIIWKYSAAISGQYHNVPVNYNIKLLSHHRLETLTPPPSMRPREENLWFAVHSFLRVRQEPGHV